jgi:hypothetical protein
MSYLPLVHVQVHAVYGPLDAIGRVERFLQAPHLEAPLGAGELPQRCADGLEGRGVAVLVLVTLVGEVDTSAAPSVVQQRRARLCDTKSEWQRLKTRFDTVSARVYVMTGCMRRRGVHA